MANLLTSSITPDSLKTWPEGSVAVVAHDAGAARLLLSWLEPLDKQLRFYLEGPALEMLRKDRPQAQNEKNVETCLSQCQLLLSGTGWSSNLEHHARSIAQKQKMKSVAVIDHWVNYPQRFKRNDNQVLPQGIWVADEEAAILARQQFPTQWVQQLENKWMIQLKKEVRTYQTRRNPEGPQSPATQLLYLLEPLRDRTSGEQNGGEFEALEYWLAQLEELIHIELVNPRKDKLQLRLRQHPSEPTNKYNEWIEKHRDEWSIALDKCQSLPESLGSTDMVFGCETQALVAALTCEIPAFSTLPPEFPTNRLPHKQLRHLNMI